MLVSVKFVLVKGISKGLHLYCCDVPISTCPSPRGVARPSSHYRLNWLEKGGIQFVSLVCETNGMPKGERGVVCYLWGFSMALELSS